LRVLIDILDNTLLGAGFSAMLPDALRTKAADAQTMRHLPVLDARQHVWLGSVISAVRHSHWRRIDTGARVGF
jgi:hypothetical protein